MLRLRSALPCALLVLTGAAAPLVASAAQATPRTAGSAAVVVHWNEVAERAITAGNPAVPSSALLYGMVSLAVHDAVVAIEGGSRPYLPLDEPRPRGAASTDVAVATAAHDVLVHLFPTATAEPDAELAAALEAERDQAAERRGARVGAAAAARLIASRTGDGRGAAVPSPVASKPGDWQYRVAAPVPMLVAWLGHVRPFVLPSPTWFDLPGPDPLTSRAYARDLAEVQRTGTATDRSPGWEARAETALFHSANVVQQHQAAMRLEVVQRRMGVAAAARAFALLGASTADSVIACWREKLDVANWRPVTAIRHADEDGNPATTADPSWAPRVATPPYGDYPSGHACVTGAASATYAGLFGARAISVDLVSSVTGTTRHYRTARALDRDAKDGRVWLGLHFRRAMDDGNLLGRLVATQVQRSALQPLRHRHHR